jgi:hypothetical protein
MCKNFIRPEISPKSNYGAIAKGAPGKASKNGAKSLNVFPPKRPNLSRSMRHFVGIVFTPDEIYPWRINFIVKLV